MHDEDGTAEAADLRERVELVEDEAANGEHPVPALGYGGHRCIWRLQYESAALALERQLHGNARAQGFAIDHEPLAAHALMSQEIQRGPGVGIEAGLGRLPRIAPVAAILQQQQSEAGVEVGPHMIAAIADMPRIAMQI